MSRVGSSFISPLYAGGTRVPAWSSTPSSEFGTEDRVENRPRVLDREAVAKSFLDLEAAGAGDGHLRRQQPGAGGRGALGRRAVESWLLVGRPGSAAVALRLGGGLLLRRGV